MVLLVIGYLANTMVLAPTMVFLYFSLSRDYGRTNWWFVRLVVFLAFVPYALLVVSLLEFAGDYILSKLGMGDEDGRTT